MCRLMNELSFLSVPEAILHVIRESGIADAAMVLRKQKERKAGEEAPKEDNLSVCHPQHFDPFRVSVFYEMNQVGFRVK